MRRRSRLMQQILSGNANSSIRFNDLCALLRRLGFDERIRGSHHIFSRDDLEGVLNLQPSGGNAKAYQVQQVRQFIQRNGLEEIT